jgi:hypothetical protein
MKRTATPAASSPQKTLLSYFSPRKPSSATATPTPTTPTPTPAPPSSAIATQDEPTPKRQKQDQEAAAAITNTAPISMDLGNLTEGLCGEMFDFDGAAAVVAA